MCQGEAVLMVLRRVARSGATISAIWSFLIELGYQVNTVADCWSPTIIAIPIAD
jgi:hypothetical protein